MDRLSALDAAFLGAEDADQHANLAIASVAVIEGPPPAQDEFVSRVGMVLAAIPRARQKVRRVPWDLGSPVWVDDPHFDPGYHFRRTALPAPGDDAALDALVARIMEPGAGRLLLAALGSLARNPFEQTSLVAGALRSPIRLAGRIVETAKGVAGLAGALRPATPSSLTGPIGRARRYGVARASLPAVLAIAKARGVTVNDVVLTAISRALRTLLLHRGERPDTHTVRTLVPVSVRTSGDAGILDNRVSLLLPFLPVDIADPAEALAAVHNRLRVAKESKEAEAGASLTALAGHEPFAPISLGIRLAARLPQRNIVTVTTNVPGPREPLYVLGRKVVELLPYVPIAVRLRIGIAILSYCDNVVFGLTGDYDSAPDLELLAEAIEKGIDELAV